MTWRSYDVTVLLYLIYSRMCSAQRCTCSRDMCSDSAYSNIREAIHQLISPLKYFPSFIPVTLLIVMSHRFRNHLSCLILWRNGVYDVSLWKSVWIRNIKRTHLNMQYYYSGFKMGYCRSQRNVWHSFNTDGNVYDNNEKAYLCFLPYNTFYSQNVPVEFVCFS